MGAETRAMKRKCSLDDPSAVASRKKAPTAVTTNAVKPKAATLKPTTRKTSPTCPLIQTLRQYGLLESIISCLFPSDLLALALSCKTTYNAIFPHPGSFDNLLSRMPCCGNGIAVRQRMHHKSTFFYAYQCTEFAQCRTASGRQNIESHPCISCRVTTCDECRIHCVYQSIYETPTNPEDLPNFSGFVLLDPFEVAILSPHHLPSKLLLSEAAHLPPWRDRATNAAAGPYHDQGFLDMPLEFDQPGTPEKISDVLDVDLGLNSLTKWSGNSQFGFPSPVLRSLCALAEKRKLSLCEYCFAEALKGYTALSPKLPKLSWLSHQVDPHGKVLNDCHCSLRSRVLDRWQCVNCYESEESTIEGIHSIASRPDSWQCRCGLNVKRTVCMWCWGEIVEGRDEHERVYPREYARIRAERGDSSEEE
ncbi:hypothetical protein BU25DRAFT_411279 [Macroventuria anomochaeta]|uniref:Uncharacterized protein n=1 Tax=Macroventuria anomochaeta TaxID=301207 RepID=A0ACB6S1E4_9PLEO|nr:uncharacterized protein BU25DRAFT_411279 [Macroventuria anomochaeta]KAF2627218.1 hypothetical protein BU25DRAFT_411279 [Macroventuria anomochaeta]